MNNKYLEVVKKEKKKQYKKVIKDLKQSNPSQWYSKLKSLCTYDMEKQEALNCEEIEALSDQEQADDLVEHFSYIRNQFDELKSCDIKVPQFQENSIPQFTQLQVKEALKQIKKQISLFLQEIYLQ